MAVADPPATPGYRPPPPAAADVIRWPDSFGQRFTVFVDTEEEFDWSAPLTRERHGTTAVAGLTPAHRRFAARGVPLAYLVDQPIADDPYAVEAIGALMADGATVGAQLHAWVTPPFDEALTAANSFAGNLPVALERGKIGHLTDTIERAFGERPKVFRSGRYGIGPATFGLLAELGYRVDSSMRSGYDYSAGDGPDFGNVGNHAFRAGPDRALIELPLTTIYTGLLRRGGKTLHRRLGRVPRGRGVFARLGLLSRVALTPEDMPLDEALEAIAVAAGEGLRFLNFAFHSPSVVPGHTPYVRDATDLARFFGWWDAVLDDLDRRGYAPASVEQIVAAAGGPGRT